MIRDGTSRPCLRWVVVFLAVWMAAFSVIAAVHNHGLPGPISKTASIERPGAPALQVGTCFACLASHVPVPAPGGTVVLSVPLRVAETVPATSSSPFDPGPSRSRSSRAPPSRPTLAA